MEVADNIWMIQMSDNPISQHFKNMVLPSWHGRGYYPHLYEAIQPKHLDQCNALKFDSVFSYGTVNKGARFFTPTEKAVWYSHYNLWQKCIEMDRSLMVIEHDSMLSRQLPKSQIRDRDDIVLLGGYLTNTKFNRSKGLHWGYRKWPGGGYIMSPDKAKSLTLHLKYNIINVNVDGFLAAFMKIDIKTWVIKQMIDNSIGTTIQHFKKQE
jgi:GR25 family glycosyltransferase involved in LPS biosynthesis